MLGEQGFPAVVVGTGNKDEDGFLAYFCKYGDGAVDIQLISDLHKHQVYQIARHLYVPDSILSAPPSADLWENQEDETELGFSYDFVEFYTGYFSKLSVYKQTECIQSLTPESKLECLKNIDSCVNIHRRNRHKLVGVVNL